MTVSNTGSPDLFKVDGSMRAHFEMNSAYFKPDLKAE
jgi:hypothetical protein